MKKIIIDQLFIGLPKEEEGIRFKTAIGKAEVNSIAVTKDAIEGDLVANLKHHGGMNRVLHQYSADNYKFMNKSYQTDQFIPGCFGENLSAVGMDELNVCIGDIYRIGEVKCIVTEPRKPCGTLNLKMKVKGLSREVQNTSRTGWFYRIIESGEIKVGDSIELLERTYPKLTIKACVEALLLRSNHDLLKDMFKNPILSDNWRVPSQKLYTLNEVPDDSLRLGED